LEDYYGRRAAEYEEVYSREDPVARLELDAISAAVGTWVSGRRVLEVACGTGYWTQPASRGALSISAVDVSKEMLEIARRKKYRCDVSLHMADAFAVPFRPGSFGGGFANFWVSHVPKKRLRAFVEDFHRTLDPGSSVFFADNVYVDGLGGELVSNGSDENTYKVRRLRDGSRHLVLKNYYSEAELSAIFGATAAVDSGSLEVFYGKRYWHVRYLLKV